MPISARPRLEPLTPRTTTDPNELRERLAAIRREGFAISLGETVPGAAGLAAPIFNADGSVTAGHPDRHPERPVRSRNCRS